MLKVLSALAASVSFASVCLGQTSLSGPIQIGNTGRYVQAFYSQGDFNQALNTIATIPPLRIGGRVLYPKMAEPSSFLINQTIKNAYGERLQGFWIGGTRPRSPTWPGNWTWVNTGAPFTFTDWGTGQPSNTAYREDRLNYWSTRGRMSWNDISSSFIAPGFVVIYAP